MPLEGKRTVPSKPPNANRTIIIRISLDWHEQDGAGPASCWAVATYSTTSCISLLQAPGERLGFVIQGAGAVFLPVYIYRLPINHEK